MRIPALDGTIALEHDKSYISRKMIFKVGKLFSNKPYHKFSYMLTLSKINGYTLTYNYFLVNKNS